jgi:hypothetical protein
MCVDSIAKKYDINHLSINFGMGFEPLTLAFFDHLLPLLPQSTFLKQVFTLLVSLTDCWDKKHK